MTPWLQDPDVTLYHGDSLQVLRQLPSSSVHMCATSPPFYGLRDYGTGEWEGGDPSCSHEQAGTLRTMPPGGPKQASNAGANSVTSYTDCSCGARRVDQQIGLEETPDQWVERLVAVFREVRRVLRDDGTLWVEIGDSYAASMTSDRRMFQPTGPDGRPATTRESVATGQRTAVNGLKPKDLLGQPWLLAFALRADGWWLRSEIIWARPNPMPESVTDRPTKSHSTVFLLSKQPRYFYDADAIREASSESSLARAHLGDNGSDRPRDFAPEAWPTSSRNPPRSYGTGANARTVWTIPTQPTPYAHFATWPEQLVRRMILAGTSERGCCPECGAPWVRDVDATKYEPEVVEVGVRNVDDSRGDKVRKLSGAEFNKQVRRTTLGWSPSCTHDHQPVPCTVLDPFAGSATTNLVARNTGRHSIGIELNHTYLQIAATRLQQLSLLT